DGKHIAVLEAVTYTLVDDHYVVLCGGRYIAAKEADNCRVDVFVWRRWLEHGGHLAFACGQYAIAGTNRFTRADQVQGDDLVFMRHDFAGADLQCLVTEHFAGLRVDVALPDT